jgi:hypothetical protein
VTEHKQDVDAADVGLDEAEPALRPMTVGYLRTHTSGRTFGFHGNHPVDAL